MPTIVELAALTSTHLVLQSHWFSLTNPTLTSSVSLSHFLQDLTTARPSYVIYATKLGTKSGSTCAIPVVSLLIWAAPQRNQELLLLPQINKFKQQHEQLLLELHVFQQVLFQLVLISSKTMCQIIVLIIIIIIMAISLPLVFVDNLLGGISQGRSWERLL